MAQDIYDAVYGCLIGGAVGDSLGAPVEGMYYTDIRAQYGKVTELMPGFGNTGPCYGGTDGFSYKEKYDGPEPQIGWFSDDTSLRHCLAWAIAEKGGRVSPDDYREALVQKLNPRRVWTGDRIALLKLKSGMNPWDNGRGNIPAGIATMSIAPVGVVNAGDPAQAYQDGYAIAGVNQEGHNRDGAATMAAGVAAAFAPGATVDDVLQAMTRHSSDLIYRAIQLTMELAHDSADVDAFAERYYAKMLDWSWPSPLGRDWDRERFFSGNTIELVPITMAILHLCRGEAQPSMIEAASFGRDCDTTASMAGSIAGALHGAGAIRADWIDTVENANRDFFEEIDGDPEANFARMARRLVGALKNEREAARKRAALLDSILED